MVAEVAGAVDDEFVGVEVALGAELVVLEPCRGRVVVEVWDFAFAVGFDESELHAASVTVATIMTERPVAART